MAVTIDSNPLDVSAVYNEMRFLLSSNLSSEGDFTYEIEVEVGGEVVATHRVSPDEDGVGYFNVSSSLESSIGNTFVSTQADSEPVRINTGYATRYTVNVGERYYSGSEWIEVSSSDSFDGTAVDASLEQADEYNDVLSGFLDTSMITDVDNERVSHEAHGWCTFVATQPIDAVTYTIVNNSGATISTNVHTVSGADDADFNCIDIATGLKTLANLDAGSFNTGVTDITSGINQSHIQIFITLDGAAPVKIYTIYQDEEVCNGGEEVHRVWFKDNRGTFDYYDFDRLGKISFKTARKKAYVNDRTRSTEKRGAYSYSSMTTVSLALESDWLSDAKHMHLRQLVSSPDVYVEHGGNIYSCTVTNDMHEEKRGRTDDLFNLSINLEFAIKHQRQR